MHAVGDFTFSHCIVDQLFTLWKLRLPQVWHFILNRHVASKAQFGTKLARVVYSFLGFLGWKINRIINLILMMCKDQCQCSRCRSVKWKTTLYLRNFAQHLEVVSGVEVVWGDVWWKSARPLRDPRIHVYSGSRSRKTFFKTGIGIKTRNGLSINIWS